MSDQGFREVQLSGKQVVFLFMAGAVALVGTFLLGVSVGKGVTVSDQTAQTTPTPVVTEPDPNPATPLPPATTPAPGTLEYHKTLQASPTPTPTDSPLPSAKPAAPGPTASPTPTAKSTAPAKPATTPKPTGAPWYVTVASFSSRANANDQIAQLKAKGVAASVVPGSNPKAPYKVRVGPMDRAAADAMVTKLRKEGFKPSSPSR